MPLTPVAKRSVKFDDVSKANYISAAFTWQKTVLPYVLKSKELWIFFGFHVVLLLAVRSKWIPDAAVDEIPEHFVHIVTVFTSIFEAFYANHCYHRYIRRYKLTKQMLGLMYDFAFEEDVYLKIDARQHMRVSCRWLYASIMLNFWLLMDPKVQKMPRDLLAQGLLLQREMDVLETIQPKVRCLVLLDWSAQIAKDGMLYAFQAADRHYTHRPNFSALSIQYESCRQLQREIADHVAFPMPFQYFHFLNFFVVLTLALWSWSMAMWSQGSLWSPVFFFSASLLLLGMAETSKQVGEPYGDDDVDFPLEEWLSGTLQDAVAIMEDEWLECENDISAAVHTERPLWLGKHKVSTAMTAQKRQHAFWENSRSKILARQGSKDLARQGSKDLARQGSKEKGYIPLRQTDQDEHLELAYASSRASKRELCAKHPRSSPRPYTPTSDQGPPPLVPLVILPFSESRLGVNIVALAKIKNGSIIDGTSGREVLSIVIRDSTPEGSELIVSLVERRQETACTVKIPPGPNPGDAFRVLDSKGAFYGLFGAQSPGVYHVRIQGRNYFMMKGGPAHFEYSITSLTGKHVALSEINSEDYPDGEHLEIRVFPGGDIVLICAIILAISIFTTD